MKAWHQPLPYGDVPMPIALVKFPASTYEDALLAMFSMKKNDMSLHFDKNVRLSIDVPEISSVWFDWRFSENMIS